MAPHGVFPAANDQYTGKRHIGTAYYSLYGNNKTQAYSTSNIQLMATKDTGKWGNGVKVMGCLFRILFELQN